MPPLLGAVERVLGPRLSDAVHLESDLPESLDVHDTAAIKHEGRLGHAVVDALVVQGLELVPTAFLLMKKKSETKRRQPKRSEPNHGNQKPREPKQRETERSKTNEGNNNEENQTKGNKNEGNQTKGTKMQRTKRKGTKMKRARTK